MPTARPRISSIASLLLAFPVVAGLLVAGGCGSSSDRTESAATTTSSSASAALDKDAYSRLGYRLVWTGYTSLSAGDKITGFEPLGDTLAVQDSSSLVCSLSPTSGELKWSTPLPSRLAKYVGMVRDGNRIIVSNESEAYFVTTDSGTLAAKQTFDRVVNTKPVLNGPILVFGTAAGEVLGHLTNGFKAWAYAVGGSFQSDPVPVGADYVGLVSQNGKVIILMPATGSAASQYKMFSGVACNPAASDTTLFVASLDQSIYAFDIFGNQPRWRKRTDTPLRSSPTYHNGRLYIEVPTAGLLCLKADNGQEIWNAKGIKGSVIGTIKGNLLVWNGADAVILDPRNGDVIERATLPGLTFLKPDNFENGNLYAVTPTGAVHKFESR